MEHVSNEFDQHTLDVQRLFVQHQQQVLAYVLSLEPNLHDAQEMVQETFVTVSRKAATFSAGSNFVAWVCSIARFNTLHYQRSRNRYNQRLAEDVVELLSEYQLDDSAVQSRITALRKCLARLAPKAHQLVNLRYHAGKLPEQIAQEIGWNANSVRVALTRARTSLRDCLNKTPAESPK